MTNNNQLKNKSVHYTKWRNIRRKLFILTLLISIIGLLGACGKSGVALSKEEQKTSSARALKSGNSNSETNNDNGNYDYIVTFNSKNGLPKIFGISYGDSYESATHIFSFLYNIKQNYANDEQNPMYKGSLWASGSDYFKNFGSSTGGPAITAYNIKNANKINFMEIGGLNDNVVYPGMLSSISYLSHWIDMESLFKTFKGKVYYDEPNMYFDYGNEILLVKLYPDSSKDYFLSIILSDKNGIDTGKFGSYSTIMKDPQKYELSVKDAKTKYLKILNVTESEYLKEEKNYKPIEQFNTLKKINLASVASHVNDIPYDEFLKMSDQDKETYLTKLLQEHPELGTNVELLFEGLLSEDPNSRTVNGKTVIGAIETLNKQLNLANQRSGQTNTNSNSSNSTPTAQGSKLNEEQTKQKVMEYLNPKGNLEISIEDIRSIDDNTFQVSAAIIDPSIESDHANTNFLDVNKNTGEIKVLNPAIDNIY